MQQGDNIIPLEYAVRTYNKAQDPKEMYVLNDSDAHGYHPDFEPYIYAAVDKILQ